MHHQKCTAEVRDARREIVPLEVFDERLAHDEWPPRERYLRFAVRLDFLEALRIELLQDMLDVGRRTDRRYGANARHRTCGSKRRGSAQAVSDQQCWLHAGSGHRPTRGDQIVDVTGETRIAKATLTTAKTRKV